MKCGPATSAAKKEPPPVPAGAANLFLYGALRRDRFLDGGGQYEATVFNYATDFDAGGGLLGFADDNWIDGTQSGVFAFVDQAIVDGGYGLSTTTIHEVGHHVGHEPPSRRLRLRGRDRFRRDRASSTTRGRATSPTRS